MTLRENVKLRSSGILQDAEKLQYEIGALEADLHRLELCREQLKEVSRIKTQLNQDFDKILLNLKHKAKVSLETFFDREEYQRADFINKRGIEAKNITNWIAKQLRLQIDIKDNDIIEFESCREAEKFADKAISYGEKRINNLLDDVRQQVQREIEEARKDLTERLDSQTKPIIEKARQRLNQAFDIEVSLPSPLLENDDVEITKPRVRNEHRYIDRGYEERTVKKRSLWHWVWLVPYEEKKRIKRPDERVDYYTVSLKELVAQINYFIEASINNISQGINKYVDEYLQQRFDEFFKNLDSYLCNYRDSLKQAQEDQKLTQEQQEKLKVELSLIDSEANAQIKQADSYLERVNDLMLGK